jgi:hypothetical protein
MQRTPPTEHDLKVLNLPAELRIARRRDRAIDVGEGAIGGRISLNCKAKPRPFKKLGTFRSHRHPTPATARRNQDRHRMLCGM